MAKVSIVVPVSNAEKYISKCLESLQEQSFSDLKIICIENGSTDNSWQLITTKRNDKRLIAMRTPEANVSYARNLGLFWALRSSPYVMFCDADDTFDRYMVETMLNGIEESRADLACCEIAIDYHADTEKKQSDQDYYSLKYEGMHNPKDVINDMDYSLCNKIFLASIIRKYSINFPVQLYYEDACFCWKYLSVADSVFFIKKRLYNYVRHENSIMNQTFAKSRRSIDHLKIADNVYNFLMKNAISDIFKNEFYIFYKVYLDLAKYYNDDPDNIEIIRLDQELQRKFFADDMHATLE